MPPVHQEILPVQGGNEPRPSFRGDGVVISGMSGLYPQSRSVLDLSNILYNKINPIKPNSTRWNYNHPEVAQCTGMVPDLRFFDAQFFKVHAKLGNSMDSMGRKLLEQSYQAIYDAGVSPEQLSGKKVGVYIGTCFSETEKTCFYVASSTAGFGIAGCSKSMFANRISYWLNAKGPSLAIDQSCCSSIAALEQAYLAISRGECEAAIVGGANLCLHPQSSLHYARIITLCKDGKTKSFDQNADGCAKSEAINVLFLQKAKDALRIYANVVHAKTEYTSILHSETGPRYGFYRDSKITANFMRKFYDEAGVPPSAVEYVEAFGSAVSEADKAELEAIDEVFCKDRKAPLLVGSVMSNIGYSEAASGISAITKVLLGYHKGELAGNLHCDTPRQDVEGIREGRLRILTDHTRFSHKFTAVNGIAVTGVNSHVLLHGHYKPKNVNRYKCVIPRLVTISGRQDSAVEKIIADLKSRPVDPEELALLHNVYKTKISGHMGRGFVILDTDDNQKTVSLSAKSDYFDDSKRQLWFVYSGMGSQWAGMGAQLMRIPIFAAAIERCHRVLAPKGINIVNIITSTDKTIFDNILHSFVGIAAVQIGLTDILLQLGLVPDKIIGHSVGELGCAYADGCLTAEEMILSAYSRGLVSVQTPFIRGSMAAVGVGYKQISKMCPPEIEVACHNGPESSTISGPADIMRDFVAKLTAQGIFAREVPCSNIAYHSRYIADAGPGLLQQLRQVIKSPKPRSERWVSTSVPQNNWDTPIAKLSSAEYHTNNLLSPVLFEETATLIPPNAVLVEIAPHGLLQAILKRSLPESCCNIALTRRGHPDNAYLVLEAVGKLYMEGFTPAVDVLYPKVEFPVSTSTPMLSHLVEWAHGELWYLPLYAKANRKRAASCQFVISLQDQENNYLRGHVIRGKILYPFAAALVAVWDTLAMTLDVPKKQISVKFRDVHLYAQPVLHDQRQLRLSVSLHRGTGQFEVLDENSTVATGFIVNLYNIPIKSKTDSKSTCMDINSENVYSLLKIKEFNYSGEFCSIHSVNLTMTEALLTWRNNWVTLIDGMLQLNVLRHDYDGISVVKQIGKLSIDINRHNNNVVSIDGETFLKAEVSDEVYTKCGGVMIENLMFRDLPIESSDNFSVKSLQFVPRFDHKLDFVSSLHVYLQIVAENVNNNRVNVAAIVTDKSEARVFKEIKDVLKSINFNVGYEEININDAKQKGDKIFANVDLVLTQHLSMDENVCQLLYAALKNNTFVLSEEDDVLIRENRPSTLYHVLSAGGGLQLVRWRPLAIPSSGAVVSACTEEDIPLLISARSSMQPEGRLLVLAPQPPPSSLTELIRSWRRESARNQIALVMINPKTVDDTMEADVNLAFNVWNNGQWGGEYYVPFQEDYIKNSNTQLQMKRVGDIDSLHWTQALKSFDDGVNVTVHYAGLNALDVTKASGIYPHVKENDSITFGMDFSGVTESGERVMGVVARGACSSEVRARPELLWPVPAHWTLEDAATVPLAYLSAFYCLFGPKMGTRIVNESDKLCVLVHGGAGGLGQAAISIALGWNYEVYTTVSDVRKKQFLLKLFPKLKEENIGNSRDYSFGDMVLSRTEGKGCDIVICVVKGELKNVSLKCSGSSGVTYDMSQLSNQQNYVLGMSNLSKERSYITMDVSSILSNCDSENIKLLRVLMCEGISRGYVRPLSRVTYAPHDAPRAFRLLAASAHRGRVLLHLHHANMLVQPRFVSKCDEVHLVLCDSSTLGLQLANRLTKRGVRKLHLHCVSPPYYLQCKVRSWQQRNVLVNMSSEDLTNDVPSLIENAMQLGPLAGIYIIDTDSYKTGGIKEPILNTLDLESRKLCPDLRYFAVVCSENNKGMQTCMTRAKGGLPATFLQIKLESGDVPKSMWELSGAQCEGVLSVLERAAHSAQPVLVAHQLPAHSPPLLHQLAAVVGIVVPENCPENATLESLGILNQKLESVCNFLKWYHNIAFSEEAVKSLTIKRIQQIEDTHNLTKFKETKGLDTFFTHVDPDELLASTEMVFMPTLTCHSMRDDEFDVTQTHLCIVPGLEGLHKRFSYLCERLKLPAVVFQPGLDRPNETIQETAQRYAKVFLNRIGFRKRLYVLGYEWGIPVALEVTSILENQGMIGTIFCIGYGPEELKAVLEEELSEFNTDEELQNGLLEHMFKLMVGERCGEVESVVRGGDTWSEKVETCVRTLLGRVPHSAQYARALLQAALGRLVQARGYSATAPRLRSRLVLLRPPRETSPHTPRYIQQLSALTSGEVYVHELSTPLAHAARDASCAAIINSYLDANILQAYDIQNLCDTYLLNANNFMKSADELEQ